MDGVLNVFDADLCPNAPQDFDLFPEDDEPVRLCMIHGDWLRELEAMFEVTWATGWGKEAPRLLGPLLGLEEYPYVPMPAIPFDPAEKVPAVDAVVGSRAAAWLDDIITPEAREWAQHRAERTLLVEVDPRRGLERHHVDQLIAWPAQLDAE